MPKKENLEFLASIYSNAVNKATQKPTLPLDDYDALLDWLFGTEERTITACARTAYNDVKRRLTGIADMPKQDKKAYREAVETLIDDCVNDLFKQKISEQAAFDVWHGETCEEIRRVSKEHKISDWVSDGITYGLAQKWLNIAIKNMLVMEKWDDDLNLIRAFLHIPVDRVIIKAASDNRSIKLLDKQGQYTSYKNGVSKPWSTWDYDEYIKFQNDVRGAVECPMDWEYGAWNKAKARRENKGACVK
jgi:hypothetical protein